MSKMQKWVTSVTFALLFTSGFVTKASAAPFADVTNWVDVAEGARDVVIVPPESVGGVAVAVGGYLPPSATDLAALKSSVSGPNAKMNYIYNAPDTLKTSTNDAFQFTVNLTDATTKLIRQGIRVAYVNDAPVFTNDPARVVSRLISGYPVVYPYNAIATNAAWQLVQEDRTNSIIPLSDWVFDEETAQTNLTYALVSQPANGAVVFSTTNGLALFTPNANVAGVTNTFSFTVSDGNSVKTINYNLVIDEVADEIIANDMYMFLEKQNGQTNDTKRVALSCIDVPAGELSNTNYTYVLTTTAGAGWTAAVSTTGDVSFVVSATNDTFNIPNVLTITSIKTGKIKTINVYQAYMPKKVPEMPPLTAPELIFPSATGGLNTPVSLKDGLSQNFAITARDMATNSWAGPAKNPLAKWGLAKIAWYICDTNTVTANVAFQKDDVTVTSSADGIEQFINGTFTFTKDMYKLTAGDTNYWIRAIATDVAGNAATNQWRVLITSADSQTVTLPQIYDVPVLSNLTVQASVDTANTVFEWWMGTPPDPTAIPPFPGVVDLATFKPAQPGEDHSFSTTNAPAVFKAFQGVVSTATPLWVRAAAFGKFGASPWVRVQANVTVPLNIDVVTLLENGESTIVAGNTLAKSPDKAYYRVGETVTLTPVTTDSAAYVFLKYDGLSAGKLTPANALGVTTLTIPAAFPIPTSENVQITAVFKSTGAVAIPVIINPGALQALLNQTYAATVGGALCNVQVTAIGAYSLTAAGLPPGMNLTGTLIAGKPTVAGSYEVTLTAKNTKGESTATFTITVIPLPEWVAGTYVGTVFNGVVTPPAITAPGAGTGTLTVQADGKSTGKFTAGGKTYSFRSNGITAGGLNPVTFTIATGLAAPWTTLTLNAPGVAGLNNELAVAATATAPGGAANLVRIEKTADAAVKDFNGYYTLSLPAGVDYGSGYLTLTVKDGNAKVAGKLADGTAVSFNATVYKRVPVVVAPAVPAEQIVAQLYVAPPKYKGGYLTGLIEFAVSADGEDIIRTLGGLTWCSADIKATAAYALAGGFSFARAIATVQGGLYSSVAEVATYYVDSVAAPELDYNQSVTDYNVDGKKVKTLVPEQAQSALFTESGYEVTPNGLAIPASTFTFTAKVDTPKQNKTTKEYEYIDNTGDGVYNNSNLKVSLMKSGSFTGVFKGSFVTYYDYVSAVDLTTNKETTKHMAKTSRFEGVLVPVREEVDYPAGAGFFLWSRKVIVPPTAGFFDKDYIYNYNESYDFRLVK